VICRNRVGVGMFRAMSFLLTTEQRALSQLNQAARVEVSRSTKLEEMLPLPALPLDVLKKRKAIKVVPRTILQEESGDLKNQCVKAQMPQIYQMTNQQEPIFWGEIPPVPPIRTTTNSPKKSTGNMFPVPVQLTEIPPPPQEEKKTSLPKPKTYLPVLPFTKFSTSFQRYVAVDVEVTGLGRNQAITEIGCVEVKNFKITGNQFHCYINPECEVGSEAHKLTGLTWHFLSGYPTFQQTAPAFMKFIDDSPLVFHDASNDLKWLTSSLEFYGYSAQSLKQKEFIDTFQIAQKMHPKDKKSLTALCELYEIDTKHREKHGALVDALLLAELFCKLARKNDSIFNNTMTRFDMKNFDELKDTPGEKFFRQIGIKGNLDGFHFVPDLYHPESKQNYPAVLIPFMKANVCRGVYVRYLIPNLESLKDSVSNKKMFYGEPEGAVFPVYSEGLETVFIGNLINVLIVKDLLLNKRSRELSNSSSIQAYVDLAYLPDVVFDPRTREVIVLIDPEIDSVDIKIVLSSLLEKLRISKTALKILIFQDRQKERKTATELLKYYPQDLEKCLYNTIQINTLQQLDRLFPANPSKLLQEHETIKRAQEIYEFAKPITPNTPAWKYFHRRGIISFLPPSFRWDELYYPWLQKKVPAIIAPMYDANRNLTAVHQIFCYEDGRSIPKRPDGLDTGRRRNKITWGRAYGAAVQFTNTGQSVNVEEQYKGVLVGEGLENTMIVAQTMADLKISNPFLMRQLYEKLDITEPFLFQACLGVNDVKQAPLPKESKNIVMLADNDGRKNLEANKAVKDSARFFLESDHSVFIALPFLPEGKDKCDFNDVYLQTAEEGERTKAVVRILLNSFKINTKEELGDDGDPLEDSLKKLLQYEQKKTECELQKNLTELLDDPVFLRRSPTIHPQHSIQQQLNHNHF